jgi:phenylalanyl-tRNA synthetase beta subunit
MFIPANRPEYCLYCSLRSRLFWSDDERFLKQFKSGNLKAKFKSYSKFPPCFKDMAFWVSPEFTENNLCELVRGECVFWPC